MEWLQQDKCRHHCPHHHPCSWICICSLSCSWIRGHRVGSDSTRLSWHSSFYISRRHVVSTWPVFPLRCYSLCTVRPGPTSWPPSTEIKCYEDILDSPWPAIGTHSSGILALKCRIRQSHCNAIPFPGFPDFVSEHHPAPFILGAGRWRWHCCHHHHQRHFE